MVEQGNVPLKKLLYVYIYIIFIYVLYECVCYVCKTLNFFFFVKMVKIFVEDPEKERSKKRWYENL